MADTFDLNADSVIAPARAPFPVIPNDLNPLAQVPKALYVGNGGTVVLRGVASTQDVTFVNVRDGQVLDVRPSHVRASGTTASAIVALV